jgi:hypothetical protein
MNEFINQAIYDFCAGDLENPANPQEKLNKTNQTFLERQAWFKIAPMTTLAVDTTPWVSTVQITDCANWAISGYMWINTDIVKYSSLTQNPTTKIWTATVTTSWQYAVQASQKTSTPVKALYEMPSDFLYADKVYTMLTNGTMDYEFVDYRDLMQIISRGMQSGYRGSWWQGAQYRGQAMMNSPYTIYEGRLLLVFDTHSSNGNTNVVYQRQPAKLTTENQIWEVDDHYYMGIAWLAASMMQAYRGEMEDSMREWSKAFYALQRAMMQENKKTGQAQFNMPIKTAYNTQTMYI